MTVETPLRGLAQTRKDGTMTCYLQVNRGDHCQESYETASRDAGRRARQLRTMGYQATVSPLGPQVTPVGTVRLTMVDIQPGVNADTGDLPADDWQLERMGR